MPQPLSNLPHITGIQFGPNVCDERPTHMLEVMRIIEAASISDQWLGNILIELTPKVAVRLAEFINSLQGDAKKATSFETCALLSLTSENHSVLHGLIKVFKSTLQVRNPFAHHRFGWTPDNDDYLLLIDPRQELLDRARRIEEDRFIANSEFESLEYQKVSTINAKKFRDSIKAYSLNDLTSITADINAITRALTLFWSLTRDKSDLKPHDMIDIGPSEKISLELNEYLRFKGLI